MPSKIHPNSRNLIGANMPRRQFHVCKSTVSNADWLYDNLPRGTLFHTVNEAMNVAQDYDDVYVWPGEYIEDATISITQDYLRLLTANMGPLHAKEGTALWQLSGSNVPVITIDAAHGVEVGGFGRIIPYSSGTAIGISVGETTECKGTWIHDCTLYSLEAQQPSLVRLGASGVEAQYTLIEDCWIYCGGNPTNKTGQIDWVHATRSTIRNNNFMINQNSANIGCITVQHTAYIRGHILDNTFWGMAENTDDMVCNAVHVDSASQAGDLVIDGNHTYNMATPFSSDTTLAHGFGLNYLNHSAIAAT